jgi:uncharacterized protein
MLLSADQIATWLKNNPNFFEDNAALLADIQIPHPHGGRAISIGERQVLTLREKNRLLENKLSELIQYGEENDGISDKIHRLALALIEAPSLDTVLDLVHSHLREHFAVAHAEVRFWNVASDHEQRLEFAPVLEEVHQFVEAMTAPYCGQHAVYEIDRWFGEAAPLLRSFALIPLRETGSSGLLVLASEDAQRFYPEMGTLYLTRLGQLVGAGVRRFVSPG